MRKRFFSERHGYKDMNDTFQIESMDDGLKNRIWNKFQSYYIDALSSHGTANGENYKFFLRMYDEFFKIVRRPSEYISDLLNQYNIPFFYFNYNWYEVYDFIEYVSEIYYDENHNNKFRKEINDILEAEMSGYRFVGNYITPIIDNVEIEEVNDALNCQYSPVKKHLSNALELLSDRENPDYQNSIKESITAVESISKIITGKETDLANCLKIMDIDLNKQFKTSMINLYGWTCKEDGIRHGHTSEELKTSLEEAKYMIVSCSAFINYLIAKNK